MTNKIQTFSSITLLLGALCYGLGLAIINLNLARYGVYEGSFARPEYILAGALFLILTIAGAVCIRLFLRYCKDSWMHAKEGNTSAAAKSLLSTLAAMGPLFLLLGWASRWHFRIDGLAYWLSLTTLATFGLGIEKLWKLWEAVIDLEKGKEGNSAVEKEHPQLLAAISHDSIGLFVWLLISVGTYATLTYPHLWAAIGGGEREDVLLLPTEEGQHVVKAVGIDVAADGLIGPLPLLMASTDELVVLNRDASGTLWAVRLNRRLFTSVASVYKKE